MPVKRHAAALLALSLAACSAGDGPKRVVEPRADRPAAARGAALLRQAMMAGHDRARVAAGVPPLIWSDALARSAADYARELARTGRFAHAEQPTGPTRQGENLFTGTRGDYSYAEMLQLWIDEKRDFVDRPTPDYSRTGRWQDVVHYTQIVWRRTTAVGCAMASNATDDYLVCRYSPTGNVVGERVF